MSNPPRPETSCSCRSNADSVSSVTSLYVGRGNSSVQWSPEGPEDRDRCDKPLKYRRGAEPQETRHSSSRSALHRTGIRRKTDFSRRSVVGEMDGDLHARLDVSARRLRIPLHV